MANSENKMSSVYLNGVQLTEKQADTLKDALNDWYENGRKVELKKVLEEHKAEIEQLPEIFKVRIDALKEVNPKHFSDSPELILSSLAAAFLTKTLKPGFKEITRKEYENAHEKYGLDLGGDVNPYLVSELVFSYFTDIKNGAIDKNGKIIEITKSKVMNTFHGWRENGMPIDAVNTVARFSGKTPKPKTDTKKATNKALMEILKKDILATNIYTLGYTKESKSNLDFTNNMIIIK